jgi:anaerobic ribonucleoside-triphosphate reductase
VKIRVETFTDERAKALLLKAHNLASERGIPYFANATQKNRKHSVFSSSGFRLDADLDGDWETDTLRTGCLGMVTINTPRIVHESGKDKIRLFESLRERIEMASRALEIKHRSLKNRGRNLLPFVTQGGNGDQYFRLENCSRIINLAGLKEAAEAFTEKSIGDEKTLAFAAELTENVSAYIHKIGRRRGKRLSPAMLPSFQASERLAQVDMERYGIAKVKFSGSRDKPFYSTISNPTFAAGKLPQEHLAFESKLAEAHGGGSLMAIDLGEAKHEPQELMETTEQLVQGQADLFTYERKMTYCVNCKKSWFGSLHKCPSCGAVGTLAFFDRFANT